MKSNVLATNTTHSLKITKHCAMLVEGVFYMLAELLSFVSEVLLKCNSEVHPLYYAGTQTDQRIKIIKLLQKVSKVIYYELKWLHYCKALAQLRKKVRSISKRNYM